MTAEFNERGLASLRDIAMRATFHFPKDEFGVSLGGQSYTAGPYQIDVIYELQPEWRFLGKRIAIKGAPPGKFKLDGFTLFRGSVSEPIRGAVRLLLPA